MGCLPGGYHVVVHRLQLLLGSIERVRRRVKLVSLEALIRKLDLERLIILLHLSQQTPSSTSPSPSQLTIIPQEHSPSPHEPTQHQS